MGSLKLRRVLITGSGHGIGKAMAHRFAEEGAEVLLSDINIDNLEQAREELTAKGGRCHAFELDVTHPEAVAEARQRILGEVGKIDVLVNNAGVVFGGPFLEVPLERHQTTFRVNVEGPVNMTHAFLPDILESPQGHLVFIASASGFVGLPNGGTYAASKWATIGFAESIRMELRQQGHEDIGVTTVCPSFINTGMFDGAKPPKTAKLLKPEDIAEKVVSAVKKRKVWVLEPWIVKLTPLLRNGLPTALGDVISDAFGATDSMNKWKGHDSKPS